MPIIGIYARQIYGNLGNPTLEVDITTDIGLFRASVPSSLHSIKNEAKDLLDDDPTINHGTSVFKAVANINEVLGPALVASLLEVTKQSEIDRLMVELDGTNDKSRLGANAILGISIATARAGAGKRCLPLYRHLADLAGNRFVTLPVPALCMINGGNYAKNKLAMQEFMVLPVGATSFNEAMEMGAGVCYNLVKVIQEKFGLQGKTIIGEEGGFAPNISTPKEALKLIDTAVQKANLKGKFKYGINAAASNFYKSGLYDLDYKNPKSDKKKWLKPEQLLKLYQELIKEFPIVSIEDPFHENDGKYWSELTKLNKAQVIGGDLTLAREERIQEALDKAECHGIRFRLHQAGSVTELIQAQVMAKYNGWSNVISHRIGDTGDCFTADLAVGLSAGLIKSGPPRHGVCLANYNQLLRIEEELGADAKYVGQDFDKVF